MFKKMSTTQQLLKSIASCGVTAILAMAMTANAHAAGASKSSSGSAAHTTVTRVISQAGAQLAAARHPAPVKKIRHLVSDQDLDSSDGGDDRDDDDNDTLKLSAKNKPIIIVKPAND